MDRAVRLALYAVIVAAALALGWFILDWLENDE